MKKPVPLLSEDLPKRENEVGTVELFFDLVFVFAVTQISRELVQDLTWLGAVHAALFIGAVWWTWILTTWTTNFLNPDHWWTRFLLFALMAAGLAMATSMPKAFGEHGMLFATAYVAFQALRSGFIIWALRKDAGHRLNFTRLAVWQAAAAVFWIAGGLNEGWMRIGLWGAALGIEYLGPALSFATPGLGRTETGSWHLEGGQMAERVGLFIIIALGESILVTGQTFVELEWTAPVVAAVAAAFVGSLAIWWIYFGIHANAAAEAIESAHDPGRIARHAYTYAPILIVAGVVVTAVGDEVALLHPLERPELAHVVVLLGGPALFLIGAQAFKYAVFRLWSPARLSGIALLGALAVAAPMFSVLALAVCATLVLVGVAVWEAMLPRERLQRRVAKL